MLKYDGGDNVRVDVGLHVEEVVDDIERRVGQRKSAGVNNDTGQQDASRSDVLAVIRREDSFFVRLQQQTMGLHISD